MIPLGTVLRGMSRDIRNALLHSLVVMSLQLYIAENKVFLL